MKSRPTLIRLMRSRNLQTAPTLIRAPIQPTPIHFIKPFSTSTRIYNKTAEEPPKQEKKKAPPKEEENAPPQSPWKVFVQTLREEIEKNQGWQDDVKQLKGTVDKAADSAAMQKARAVYERVRVSRFFFEKIHFGVDSGMGFFSF